MKLTFPMPNMVRPKATSQPWEADVTGADQKRLARLADELGYDMLSVPEHFIIPNEHVALSGPHYLHAAAGQGFFAGATDRILINSSIAILPRQNPIATAKALATIDWMSGGGRIIATFGVGWLEKEFELMRVPFHERGRMSEDISPRSSSCGPRTIRCSRGSTSPFATSRSSPSRRRGRICRSGSAAADAVLRRAARYASGWWPFRTKPEDIPARIDFIKSQPTFKGGPFEIMYGFGTSRVGEGHVARDDPKVRDRMSVQKIVDRLGWFRTLGVTMSSLPLPPLRDLSEFTDHVRWAIEEIKPRLA